MRTLRTVVVLLCLALVGVAAPAASAGAAVTQKGTYYPVASARLLDTRSGTGGTSTPLGAGRTLLLAVAGHGGVPSAGASAAVVNLTATRATANSYLTAYPSKPTDQTPPKVSSINFRAGVTRANSVTVPIGSDGKIAIHNSAGSVDVLVDVLGFYALDDRPAAALGTGAEFTTVDPSRLEDTRQDPQGALLAGDNLIVDVDFDGGAGNSSVKALALNVTAVGAVSPGYLTAWNGKGSVPGTSSLNFQPSTAIANTAVVRTSLCTDCDGSTAPVEFKVYNGSKDPVHVLVDLVGVYYNDGSVGLRFSPMTPVRISDSRVPKNGRPLAADQTQDITAPTAVAGADTVALVTNVAVVAPTASTYLTLWAQGETKPSSSNLNAPPSATVANGAVVALSEAAAFSLYNHAGTGNFVVDVTGRFDIGDASASARAARVSERRAADHVVVRSVSRSYR